MTRATVSESTKLYVPAAAVWELVGGFLAIGRWHPHVLRCEEARDGTQKLRRLDIAADSPLVERLEEHDASAMRYDYTVISGPLPVRDATGRLWVHPDTARSSTTHWEISFAPAGVTRADAVAAVQDFVRPGLAALRFRLAG
jgi:hypothetical protein